MKPIRVLICEDDPTTALLLRQNLETQGYEVIGGAGDGVEAVESALRHGPDVILMDFEMPKRDGITATLHIMSERPVPIVMLTAHGEADLIDAALRAGAMGYLIKPVYAHQVVPAITVAIQKYAQIRDLHESVAGMKEALETRKRVEQAKGVLMRRDGLAEEDAYRSLQKISRSRRQTLKETAEQVLKETAERPTPLLEPH